MADENKEVVIVKEPEQEKNDSSNMEMNIETPKTKKRRLIEENHEKMLTIKEKDKKIIIEYETKALSKLCSDTGDQKIRKFIECYQQSEQGDIEEAKNEMLKLSDIYTLSSITINVYVILRSDNGVTSRHNVRRLASVPHLALW